MKKTALKLVLGLLLMMFIGNTIHAQKITPETALASYIDNGDKTYNWELKDSIVLEHVTAYHLLLTSQKWREYTWRHQLTVFIPKKKTHDGAMLFITGGSNKDEQPNWTNSDDLWEPLAEIAVRNQAVVAIIRQVPNQPLYGDLTEDALISYTLHQFKQDKDYSWPLLFPMVKSAVKGMDAIQEFAKQKVDFDVNSFVISGASKRGWTTWLTSAIDDKRVKAIGPMVIDMLNMPATLNYQYTTYGEYSIQIEDYVKLGIPQGTETKDGKALTTMIDPFSYRKNMTVPKMIFIGTNDEYWTADAIKHYFSEIPGKNMIHYVPNAGHGLGGGEQALKALNAFFGLTLMDKSYPVSTWTVNDTNNGAELIINPEQNELVEATLWETTSSDRDFRNNLWKNKNIKLKDLPNIKLTQAYPKKGFQAFYVEMKYKGPTGGTYSVSTRIFVSDKSKVL
ncbi:PhoPQ-activated protein PqaA family protein [uncultured Arcticibacterium sp.]|uniref:PhoPQ-activated pathogenicity-related family protein n=1 Tax=uncultured Arcticibacterium sp. TaxID=2173042 RepID=UPI0030F9698A